MRLWVDRFRGVRDDGGEELAFLTRIYVIRAGESAGGKGAVMTRGLYQWLMAMADLGLKVVGLALLVMLCALVTVCIVERVTGIRWQWQQRRQRRQQQEWQEWQRAVAQENR